MGAGKRRVRLSRVRAGVRGVLLAAAALSLSACRAFESQRANLEFLNEQGRWNEIARDLDDPATRDLYGDKNRLLWWLDRGTVALATGDHARTIDLLERAERWMEEHNTPSAGDQAARWLINDTAAPYFGEPYEDIYVNVIKLMAQLERGQVQGGATVEARRLASKADLLRDRYLKWSDAVRQQGGPGFDQAAAAVPAQDRLLASANEQGQFIESTLGTYLTAVTFMASGEPEMQRVAGRRLADSIRMQRGLIGRVREEDFAGIGEMRASEAGVLVVALSGTAPTKRPVRIGPIPVFTWPVYFELPELVGGISEAAGARVVVESADASGDPAGFGPGANDTRDLALVEDLRRVAMENHRRQLPLIYARSLLRSSLKAGASFALTESMRGASGSGRESERDLMVLGGVIAGMAFLALTEKADLRAWSTLPGQAHVGTLDLPPGRHRVRVEYLSSSGGVIHATRWRDVEVSGRPGDIVTVVERFWR